MAKNVDLFGTSSRKNSGKRRPLQLSQDLAKAEAWVDAILPADANAEANESQTKRRPLVVMSVFVVVALTLLGLRLATLQLLDGSKNLAVADGNLIRETKTTAPRGLIYDSQGNVIAKNDPAYDVIVTPMLLPENASVRQSLYTQVGNLIGMSQSQVATIATPSCVTETACSNSYEPQVVKANITRDQALLFEQDEATLTGFSLDVNPIREYDDVGNYLAPILGYTGLISSAELKANPGDDPTDLIGQDGLEEEYEKTLKGQDGYQQTEVDATGKPVKTLASQPAIPGDNLVLSIDQGLEQEMAKDIGAEMVAAGAPAAAGVAVNPNTGAILAAVSLPTYNNNEFAQGITQAEYNQLLATPGDPLVDKVINGEYPSGSIIKPVDASAALQEGIITTSTTVDDEGKIVVPNPYDPSDPAVYNGWNPAGLGVMNVFSALAESSDIFFYTIVGGFYYGGGYTDFTHPLGINLLTHYEKLFGLGSPTGIDLPHESAGLVPTPAWKKATTGQPWYLGDTYNMAIGQGNFLVTPIQMAMATSVVANGGKLLQPYLVQAITNTAGKVVKQTKPHVVRQGFISAQNLAIVRQGMLDTTESPEGTACCKIKVDVPVLVGAKTGSAETDTSAGVKPEAWFSEFAPYNNPQIVVIVFLEKAGEGADYAAPAGREIFTYYFTQGEGKKYVGQ